LPRKAGLETPWILVLCHEFPPIGGGAAKNLHQLCRELARRGIGVRVLTSDPGSGNRLRHPFEVEYLATGRKHRFETRLLGMLGFVWKAARRASASGFRGPGRPALILSCLGIPAGLAGTWASRRLGAPHAVWYHGSDVHGGRPGGCGTLQRLLLRRVARAAAHNLFVSPGLRGMAEAIAAIPGAALLPSCPSPEILAAAAAPTGSATSPRRDAGAAGAAPPPTAGEGRYFLFLGRFEPVKNPLLILEALALLEGEGRAVPRFRFVGGGALAETLRARLGALALGGQAVLEGPAAYDQVPDLLRGAYALVVPSRVEGMNTTILEAARFGVPAVGSDTVGVRDFVRPGETGLLFPEGDAGALARALLALAGDPSLRDALGARAREAALPYSGGRVAEAFLAAVSASVPGLASRAPTSVSSEEAAACP
jgi:glycosyltransferase involved in cell wall biosynthesis